MIEGLLGRKLGMIQYFDQEGRVRGATVIEAGPCLVSQIRTAQRDGYEAVQLGFGTKKRATKPARGHLQGLGDLRYLREFKAEDISSYKIGDRVGVEIFHEGDQVDVTGVSKGRGFAGGVKRHGFAGGPKTHGQSDRHRAPGAIGAGNTPGRVFKGMRMAGHMGTDRVTVKNLEVLASNPARGLLIVAGAVPGAKDGLLRIRYSRVSREAARGREPLAFDAKPEAEDAEEPVAEVATEETEAAAAQPEAAVRESASADEAEASDDAEAPDDAEASGDAEASKEEQS